MKPAANRTTNVRGNSPAPFLAILLAFPLGCLSGSTTLAASKIQGTTVDTETGFTDQFAYQNFEFVHKKETPYLTRMPEIKQMESTSPATGQSATEVATGSTISEEKAKEIALKAVPGEVMDVAVERKLGANRFIVEIIADADGAEIDVIIEMETGKVLAIDD